MVEGSKIDYRSHDNDSEGILAEMRDFEKCVAAAMDYADTHPGTLVIICADHETGGLTIIDPNENYTKTEFHFSNGSHSPLLVPIFTFGPGAEKFTGIMDNTDIMKKILDVIN